MADPVNQSDQGVMADLLPHVQRLIGQSIGSNAKIQSTETVSGGCINSAICCYLENGECYFVKFNQNLPGVFELEAEGLEAIRSTDTLKAPEVLGSGETELGTQFLVLEFISQAPQKKNFFETFGRQLAQMHRANQAEIRFGFPNDNFIGSTPQKNTWNADWIEFFAVQRLEFQLKLANHNGLATSELNQRCDKLILRLDRFINSSEPPALVHGDLWSGNYLVSQGGIPVLIDPAVYFGARESEFGMIKLFGGFNSQFYHAYNEAYSLSECLKILRKLG